MLVLVAGLTLSTGLASQVPVLLGDSSLALLLVGIGLLADVFAKFLRGFEPTTKENLTNEAIIKILVFVIVVAVNFLLLLLKGSHRVYIAVFRTHKVLTERLRSRK